MGMQRFLYIEKEAAIRVLEIQEILVKMCA